MSNKEKAIQYINTHSLTGIKAGADRTSFLYIWMVTVQNRIFIRSWGFAERSWYNSFLTDAYGQIKCGDDIFNVKATVVKDTPELTASINKAYLDKYNHGENSYYAKGIIQQQHIDKTMELEII